MASFDRGVLEASKYADLVKLAKENGVYRRYAPKAELVAKLLALNETPLETLSDVSMPTFTDDETDTESTSQGIENVSPHDESIQQNLPQTRRGQTKKNSKVVTFSPRPPLLEKGGHCNSSILSESESSGIPSCKSDDLQHVRKSLAGPAKPTIVRNNRRQKFKSNRVEGKQELTPELAPRRMTRQRTFDIDTPQPSHKVKEETLGVEDQTKSKEKKQMASSNNLKREGTFEVDKSDKTKTPSSLKAYKLTRENTFEVQDVLTSQRRSLRREGTFEVESPKISESYVQDITLKREGTFEVNKASKGPSEVKKLTHPNRSTNLRLISNRVSETKKPSRGSLRTPCPSKRMSVATPSSVKNKFVNARLSVTSRSRMPDVSSSGKRLSGSKSKIPSLVNEIQRKKAEVSAQKMVGASAGFKPTLAKKVPDFSAIHSRLFDKMESIADSVQKVKDKAFSTQKNQVKSARKSPPKAKAARKLLSPKVGRTKLASPKPLFHDTASAFASKVVSIQKRPSTGSSIPGISKLMSPKPQHNFNGNGVSTKFGFVRAEPSRKEALKASVIGRKPMKRNSPMSKAKQALTTVRLNKRFELQMKHRIAQQANQD